MGEETIVFTFSHSSLNLSCSHVLTLKYDRAHQDGMGEDRHNGVCSLWHPSLHPLLHEYGQGWYHHHHHHCSRKVFANIFKWVYRWVHGCIARRKAAAKYVNFYDDNDDGVVDHFYQIRGNGDLYIYRYGVMGDDREALEMLGEEVTSSVKHRIVNKTKLSNNICDRCLCLHRLLYGWCWVISPLARSCLLSGRWLTWWWWWKMNDSHNSVLCWWKWW